MVKWKRVRKLREKKRAETEVLNPKAQPETELAQPEMKSDKHTTGDPRKIKKSPQPTRTFNSNTSLAKIPPYVYLLGFFVLLSGIFLPLVINRSFDTVIAGTATLFLGLVGAILLFKGATSSNRQGIFIAIGFTLVGISVMLIYQLQGTEQFLTYFNPAG